MVAPPSKVMLHRLVHGGIPWTIITAASKLRGNAIRQALETANILPSTVVVSFNDRILPHSTVLQADVKLLVTTVSSGG